jgi:arabinosaccharide transport system substrate-binding protein
VERDAAPGCARRGNFVKFPYGKAPFWILALAVVTGTLRLAVGLGASARKPDLVFALFASNHMAAYEEVVPLFEKENDCRIQLQLVNSRALQSRLQSALLTGADVPDMVELLGGSMGYFTRGPLEDVGFVDLTERLHAEGLYENLVESRFSLWSSRGRVFAIPHDVHPVMLCYRRDLIDELGIDVGALGTWADFVRMGRRVTKDLDGDGNPDRYALDLPASGGQLPMLVLQRGGGIFDEAGRVVFDTELVADTVIWYIHRTRGPGRIAFDAGWGQSLAKAMNDGLVLFYVCPDWRTKQFEMDVPNLAGRLALMPLPAWEPGGRRTSTWGGTGLAITKACRHQRLAWKLAKRLYFEEKDLGARFRATNIIPPVKSAWDLPVFREPREFYGAQAIGLEFAELAPSTPADHASPYTDLARGKLSEAYLRAAEHYDTHGDEGLRECALKELSRSADYVRKVMSRNVFLKQDVPK